MDSTSNHIYHGIVAWVNNVYYICEGFRLKPVKVIHAQSARHQPKPVKRKGKTEKDKIRKMKLGKYYRVRRSSKVKNKD